jgi:hypothetical protein
MPSCTYVRLTGGLTVPECLALSALLNASKSYLEFGAGVSTRLAAASPSLAKIVSIESDQAYINQTRASLADHNRVEFRLAPVGRTGLFGYPLNRSVSVAQYTSVLKPGETFDLVLVDGRFRIAAAARSHRHLSKTGASRLLVHDFARRPAYAREMLNSSLYRLIEEVESLAVFAPVFYRGDIWWAQRMEDAHARDMT